MKNILATSLFTNFNSQEVGNKIRVLFVQANRYASGYYRIGFIAEELAKISQKIDVDFTSSFYGREDISLRIGQADVVVFQLQTSDLSFDLINICKKNGIAVVMDMDDDLLNVPEWNPAYFGLGRKHSKLWDSDARMMDVRMNRSRLNHIRKNLRQVDLITVTGMGLRNEYSKYNKVKILPNCVDEMRIKTSKRSGGWFDDKIRIFWQGSSTHIHDLLHIRKAVKHITEKYPQVQWVIWGSGYKMFAEIMGIPKKRVETKATVQMEDYYDHLKKIKMDIGICPLVDIPYNHCKSNIKWQEYSLCGIPTVASDVVPYNDSILHRQTGFLAKNDNDWIEYLSRLINSHLLRQFMAENAKVQVLRDYNIHSKIALWEETLIKVHQDNLKKNGISI